MGEIRIVGPGKTRGYPYPICKKTTSATFYPLDVTCELLFDIHAASTENNGVNRK